MISLFLKDEVASMEVHRGARARVALGHGH
jgi:hypothetical protein